MKIVVACDSFKGCLKSYEVNDVVEKGIKKVVKDIEVIKISIADGGEGTVHALVEGLGGKYIEVNISDPLMRKIKATYGILDDDTAIIEVAACIGLPLLKEEERNPLETTTYGVGEIIKDAIQKGVRKFIIGIGGSSTNDAGLGVLEALGYKFYDENNNLLKGVGKSLEFVKYIDDTNKLKELDECSFTILCDVDNPFYGDNGAAKVYAKQKGASDEEIEILDKGLKNFSLIIKNKLGKDISHIKGSGAAGGLGGGFYAFLDGKLLPGIDVIFEKLGIEEILSDTVYIVTGEGKIDSQSVMGKVLSGIGKLGKKYNIPVIGICGTLEDGIEELHKIGFTSLFSVINKPMSLEMAMDKNVTKKLIEENIIEIFRLLSGTIKCQ